MEGIMKKFWLLIVFIFTTNVFSQALLLEENFDYPSGDSLTAHNWSLIGTNFINNCNVSTVGNNYLNYPGSNIDGSLGAQISNLSSAEEVVRGFNSQSSGIIYFSVLVNVSIAPNPITPTGVNAFIGINNATTSTTYPARIIATNPSGSTLKFGVVRGANSINATMGTTNFSLNTTYLIVLKYTFVSGTTNDSLKLFVFSSPSLPLIEPTTPEVSINSGGIDASALAAVFLRQDNAGSSCIIDGIRVATTWSEAPLPVELSSFSASVIGSMVKLNWVTATEINNYGFDVERTSPFPSPYEGEGGEAGRGWEKIGFVNGNGNSNSTKSYSFVDDKIIAGKYSYRLKQIDNDGQFEYSKTIEVDLGAPKKFELSQNYPNPFNPATTIRFNLPEAANVKLTIFNLLGEQIKTLVNEFKEAGVHTINFNAENLNSGLYIYKLEAGSFIQTRKMTLVK
jgi:hypothetical protein